MSKASDRANLTPLMHARSTYHRISRDTVSPALSTTITDFVDT